MPHTTKTHLPHIRFDSLATSPTTALEYWRDSLSRSWEVSIDAQSAPAFRADVAMWRMADLIAGTGRFGPVQTRMRREKNIRFDQLDHYRLLMLRNGQFACDAGGRQISLTPGRFVLSDMALPESSESCAASTLLYIPRESLERALPRPMDLYGVSPVNACAGLLADHLTALLQGIAAVSTKELPGLSQATVNLVAASLALTPDNGEAARPAIDSVLLRRARQRVESTSRAKALARRISAPSCGSRARRCTGSSRRLAASPTTSRSAGWRASTRSWPAARNGRTSRAWPKATASRPRRISAAPSGNSSTTARATCRSWHLATLARPEPARMPVSITGSGRSATE